MKPGKWEACISSSVNRRKPLLLNKCSQFICGVTPTITVISRKALVKYLRVNYIFVILGNCIVFNCFYDITADLKSRYDEERSLREAAEQRLARMTVQLQTEQQENEKLQSELVQNMQTFSKHSCFASLFILATIHHLPSLMSALPPLCPPSCSGRGWRMWRFCGKSWCRCRLWWTTRPVRGRKSRSASKTSMSSCRLTTLPLRWNIFIKGQNGPLLAPHRVNLDPY